MLKFHHLMIVVMTCTALGCQQRDEKVLRSWDQFVEEAKSGKADFTQKLSADMKHHGYWYDWSSSEFHPQKGTGTIKIRVSPPVGDWYEVEFEFQQNGDTWVHEGGFQYQEQRSSDQN